MKLEIANREEDPHEALKAGKAVQHYEMDYTTAIERYGKSFPEADYWYTERQGDCYTMLVPAGTPKEALPTTVIGRKVFQWIKHDEEFT